jgi:hypothetical protein
LNIHPFRNIIFPLTDLFIWIPEKNALYPF